MRHRRMVLGFALTVCALCASATSVAAHEFVASRLPKPPSEALPGKTKGIGIGSTELGGETRNQELRFGVFTIVCAAQTSGKTIPEGAISWSFSPIFATEIKFEKCLTKASYGGFIAGTPTNFNVNPETKKSEPVKFVYHVNGFAEIGVGEVESEVELGAGNASFSIGGGKVCQISWPRQTMPAQAVPKPEGEYSTAVYSNKEVPVEEKKWKTFPSHFQDRLVIANAFHTMEWSYEEGQCRGEGGFEKGTNKTEAKDGIYYGTLEEEFSGGNLSFR